MEQDNHQQMSDLSDLEVMKKRFEQQEAAKAKAEEIVSTLTRIRAREKASRRRLFPRDESSIISSSNKKSHSSPNSAIKEKSNLLKQKLEEDRARLESRRGSENLDKMTEVVENIKAQVEDRGKLIHELLLSAQQQQIKHEFIKDIGDDSKSLTESPSEPQVPDEIKQKIADLEAKIIDLQENLKEKDEVISARTQAITLLSDDMSRKSKATLDTLEETQVQMKQMQNNFIAIEDRMKKQHQRLKEEAENRKERCLQAEKNLRIVEAARFDLSTRVAELQEKVVSLQTKNIELEKNVSEAETKQDEMKKAYEAEKNKSIKMKAQFKIKMKTLEEERDLLKKMTKDGSELTSLQERIAELEEEKEQSCLFKERVTELEQRLSQQSDDLDSHVKAMSKLELEKLDLIQVVQERNSLLSDKESLIIQLQQQLAEVEQLKVSAEMRSIELEEKLDAMIKNKKSEDYDYASESGNLRQQLIMQEDKIRELEEKLSRSQNGLMQGNMDKAKLIDLNTELDEWKQKYLELESRYNEINGQYKSLEDRVEEAENQNKQIVIECYNLRLTVTQLQNVIKETTEESNTFNSFSAATSTSDGTVMKALVGDSEKDVEINRVREELAATSMELHRLSTALDNMNFTAQQVDELNNKIIEKDKELTNVSNELDKRTRKLSEYKKFHRLKSEDVLRVSHELETVTISCQDQIEQLQKEIVIAHEKEIDLQNQIKELKENQSTNQPPLNDQTQKIKKLAANLKLKVKTCKDLEEKLHEYEKIIEEKENSIKDLIAKESTNLLEITELRSKLNENTVLPFEKSSEAIPTDVSNKLESLIIENDNFNSQILYQQQLISQLENEIKILRDERESAFAQLDKLHENEFSKNDELFKMFEIQVGESRKEIIYLQDQLKDVASKYEQAWAKLQEKEAYIESVEGELTKAKEKMRSIESTTDEMRQNLKEKAELLGDRLKKAEETNIQFEYYRSEIEGRIAVLAENETFLKNSLSAKMNENEELKRLVSEISNRNEWFEREANNMQNYVINMKNELANLSNIQDAHNHSQEEIEKLNNDIKRMKLANEKIIAEVKEREKLSVECLENELKSFSDKCNAIENERNCLLKEFESLQSENQTLKKVLDKQKMEFDTRISFTESERNRLEELYSKLKMDISINEENSFALSESKSNEIESIMTEQRLLVEKLHSEFKQKEDRYIDKMQQQEEHIKQLQKSLQNIEAHAELLKSDLNKVGSELKSSKEELVALLDDQEKAIHLKDELGKIKQVHCFQLEKQQELVRTLQFELMCEKARKEVDNVVKEAEIKVDSLSQAEQVDCSPPLFQFSETTQDDAGKSFDMISQQPANSLHQSLQNFNESEVDYINDLKHKLSLAMLENQRLSSIISSYNSKQLVTSEVIQNVEPNLFSSAPPCRVKNKDEEDGWGWGADEVVVEQETAVVVSANLEHHSSSQQVEIISSLEQKLRDAEIENSKLSEEFRTSQVRCSKLIKKAKELKAKSEGLERESREKSVGFEDLDFAMQEELRGRIEKLEKSLQEALNENKHWKIEKENYCRKIDTLTSGNERLVDMKERQDIDLNMFQKHNSDLKQQILGFEWKIEELMEENEKLTASCSEMEEKINSLASENDNLIKIVGDLKDQLKTGISSDQQPSNSQEANQNPIFAMFRDNLSNEQPKQKDSAYNSLLQNYEILSAEKNNIVAINNELTIKVDSFNARINELEIENYDLKNRIENFLMTSGSENNEDSYPLKENEHLQFKNKLDEEILSDYEEKLEKLLNENRELVESLRSLSNCNSNLEDHIRIVKTDLESKYENLLIEFNVVNDELQTVKHEKDILNKKLQETLRQNPEKEVTKEPTGAAVVFRGFADDSLSADPFNFPQDVNEEQHSDLHGSKVWNTIDQTENDKSSIDKELKEQVSALTTLLQEKEMELEITKQSLDNIKLEKENLLDVWSKKYDDLKMEQSKRYDNLKIEESKKYDDLQIEQTNLNTDNYGAYEDFLNVAEQKFKDDLLLKDEEIAHLTCHLSSKEQELININKEITSLKETEAQLNATIEKYKEENINVQKMLNDLRDDCVKLQNQLQELLQIKTDHETKLNEAELILQNLQMQNEEYLKTMKDESEAKCILEQNYSTCCHHLEEKESLISEKDQLLEQANNKIKELNDLCLNQIKDYSRNEGVSVSDESELQNQSTEIVAPLAPSIPMSVPSSMPFNESILVTEVNILKLRLDEALYTLHLRDVRCEELTLELMQLLEERDTLQLRLSTAIRLNEELRRKPVHSVIANVVSEQMVSTTNNSSSCTTRTSSIEHNQSSSDQETTPSDSETGRLDRLNEKLGELHTIGYQRDLSLHQDRIKRHNEQMHLYSPDNSPQQSSASQLSTNDDSSNSGGFLSWIFGSNG